MIIKRVFLLLLAFNSFLNFRCYFLASIRPAKSLRLAIVGYLHSQTTVLSVSSFTRSQLLALGQGGLGSLLGLPLGFDLSASGRFGSNLVANPAILVASSNELGCLAGGARFMKFCVGAGAARRLAGCL